MGFYREALQTDTLNRWQLLHADCEVPFETASLGEPHAVAKRDLLGVFEKHFRNAPEGLLSKYRVYRDLIPQPPTRQPLQSYHLPNVRDRGIRERRMEWWHDHTQWWCEDLAKVALFLAIAVSISPICIASISSLFLWSP